MRRESTSISPVSEIVAELRAGNIVVLVDDEDRENEGDLVFAADFVTAEKINFLAKHGRGLICMPVTPEHAERLGLEPMVSRNRSRHGTNFTASIEAAVGIATGISAQDRALTVRVAASPQARAADIVQPGHVFPLIAAPGGVLMRAGHTEACCDLARMAGLTPAAVLCEIMNDDGTMARLPELVEFAAHHGLKIGTIAELIEYRSANESLVERIADRALATAHGPFRLTAWRDRPSGGTHLALSRGEIRREHEALVRVHEPLTVLDLLEPGAGGHSWGIDDALAAIGAAGTGVLVLLNCAQDDAALVARLAGPAAEVADNSAARTAELRTYGIGAQILRELGVGRMRLMAAPRKMPSMAGFGLEVAGYLERPDRGA